MKPTNKRVDLKKLEDGWQSQKGFRLVPNSRFPQIPQEPKRYQRMSEDIRNFSNRAPAFSFNTSTSISEMDPQPSTVTKSTDQKSPFEVISTAFGFSHHAGTDRATELKVLKQIVKRENLKTSLQSSIDKVIEAYNLKGIRMVRAPSRSDILSILTSIRNITVELVESICIWRLSSGVVGETPKPFLWEGKNYLIQLQSDLDFMSEVKALYELLSIPRDKLLANPLMLPNSIFEAGQWETPEECAKNGKIRLLCS